MKVIKWILKGAVYVILLALLGAFAFLATVDADDYKTWLADRVAEQTGRQLTLDGDADVYVFPWFGLKLTEAHLTETPAFGGDTFLTADRIQFRFGWLPLLRGVREIDTIVVHGAELHLERNEAGRGNWEDLVTTDDWRQSMTEVESLSGIDLFGVDLDDVVVHYRDAANATETHIGPLELTLERFRPSHSAPFRLATAVQGTQAEWQGELSASGELVVDPQQGLVNLVDTRFDWQGEGGSGYGLESSRLELAGDWHWKPRSAHLQVDDLEALTEMHGEAVPGMTQRLEVRGALNLDGKHGRFLLRSDAAELASIPFRGVLAAQLAVGASGLGADIETGTFDPQAVARALGMGEFIIPDQTALASAQAAGELRADASGIRLENLTAQLDDTRLTGTLQIRPEASSVWQAELALDRIDLDRYWAAPALGATSPASTDAADDPAGESPIAALYHLVQDAPGAGELTIDRLELRDTPLDDMRLAMRSTADALQIPVFHAGLNQGRISYAGSLRNPAAAEPTYTLDTWLRDVPAEAMARLLGYPEPTVTGTLQSRAALEIHGSTAQGYVDLALSEGRLTGFDLTNRLAEASPAFAALIEDTEMEATVVERATGRLEARGAQLSLEQAAIVTPDLWVEGSGTIAPQDGVGRYTLETYLRPGGTAYAEANAEQREGPLAFIAEGDWADPPFRSAD